MHTDPIHSARSSIEFFRFKTAVSSVCTARRLGVRARSRQAAELPQTADALAGLPAPTLGGGNLPSSNSSLKKTYPLYILNFFPRLPNLAFGANLLQPLSQLFLRNLTFLKTLCSHCRNSICKNLILSLRTLCSPFRNLILWKTFTFFLYKLFAAPFATSFAGKPCFL